MTPNNVMQNIQNALGVKQQATQSNPLQYNPYITTTGGTTTVGNTPDKWQDYVDALKAMQNQQILNVPQYTPPSLPDPSKIKKEFEEYLKRYLTLYSGMYTNPYEKELIENLRRLLVLNKVKDV